MSSPALSHPDQENTNSPSKLSPLEMSNYTSPNHSPQPELVTMTNVNVLDLHKDYTDDGGKIYEKDNSPIYVYTEDHKHNNEIKIEEESDRSSNSTVLHRVVPQGDHVIDEQIITDFRSEQLLTKLASDDHILRLVGPNGESQQIISREIINGEHHILTRNENGDHTITRIVSAGHNIVGTSENAIYTTNSPSPTSSSNHHKIITTSPHDHQNIVYTTSANDTDHHITTSVLHYESSKDQQPIYTTTTSDHDKLKNQMIYTHGDKDFIEESKDDSYSKSPTAAEVTASTTTTTTIYTTSGNTDEKLYEKSPIDLIYDDGISKTVIYTSADPKTLELYAGNEMGLISEGQVIVQGGLHYATQQIDGQTVFVVSEQMEADITDQIQRLVFFNINFDKIVSHLNITLFIQLVKYNG